MKHMEEAMTYVKTLGYFQDKDGSPRNHVVPFVYDYGKCMSTFSKSARAKGYPKIFNQVIAVGELGTTRNNMIAVGALGTPWGQSCFSPKVDLVVPPLLLRWQVDALEKEHKPRVDQVGHHHHHRGASSSTLFVYFRGDINQGPDGTVRRQIVKAVQKSLGDEKNQGQHAFRFRTKKDDVGTTVLVSSDKVLFATHVRDLGRATFCLCPPGFSNWSYRMVESILAGCIPVLFVSSGDIQPWEQLGLVYSTFAVVLGVKQFESILPKLRTLSIRAIRAKQKQLALVAPLFSYHRCGAHMFVELMARRALLLRKEVAIVPPTLPTPIKTPPTIDHSPVDVVFTWVNGSEPSHVSTLAKTRQKYNGFSNFAFAGDAASSNRFRDHHELRYAMRSVAINAPWVRRIYLVTAGIQQIPSWFKQGRRNKEQEEPATTATVFPEVVVVHHADFFPREEIDAGGLPSFNSIAIETYMHLIPGLAENFVIMNDDFFFRQTHTKI